MLASGFRYLKGSAVLQSTFSVDIVAMVFGMPRALFPVLAVEQFGRRTRGGRLALLARSRSGRSSARSARVGAPHPAPGLAILVAVTLWGVAIAASGCRATGSWLALVFLAWPAPRT